MKNAIRIQQACIAIMASIFTAFVAPAQTVWIGTNNVSATTNWSDTANWSTASSPFAMDVIFTNNGVATLGTINNVVDSDQTLSSLTYANTNGTHTTLITPGRTLTITGGTGPSTSLLFGGAPNTTDVPAFTNVITGAGGALVLNNSGANLMVRQGPNNGGAANRTTLDLSGLDTFSATVGRVLLSGNSPTTQNRSTGRLMLARTNVIVASGSSPALIVGESTSNNGSGSTLALGQTNALFVNNIAIGRTKESGSSIRFNAAFASPYVIIRAADGASPVSTWTLGDGAADSGTTTCNGTADFSLGTIDALVTTMQVGRGSSGGTGGNQSVGSVTIAAGTLEITTLQLGMQGGSNSKGGSGTMNVNGTATLIVNTTFEMGRTVGGDGYTNTLSRLNINGGKVYANSINANFANSTNNSISMTNGTLIVTNTVGPGIRNFTMTNSSLTVPVLISGPSVIVTNFSVGGATNRISVTEIPGSTGYPAQFPIIKYTGALGGSFNIGVGTLPASTPAYAGFISNNAANGTIDLVVTAGPVPLRNLTWDGSLASGTWDIGFTANWKTNIGPGTIYNDGDFVRFDDTASGTTAVNLSTTLSPGSVNVSNQTKAYGFTGGGILAGDTGITKDGAETLFITNGAVNTFSGVITINNGTIQVGDGQFSGHIGTGNIVDNGAITFAHADGVIVGNQISGSGTLTQNGSGSLMLNGANTYTGATAVNQGTLVIGNATALGTTNGGTTVASGATLDFNGRNIGLEPVTVSGSGVSSAGALYNSGAAVNPAVAFVTLAGDTVFGGVGRWDLRSSASGNPALSSLTTVGNQPFKLTKVGINQVSIVGTTVGNLGDVEIQAGILSLEVATTSLGNVESNLTVFASASLQLFQLTNQLNKRITLTNDGVTASIINNSGANTIIGPITMTTDCIFNVNGTSLTLAGNLTGGLLIKNGTGNLILANNPSHAGTLANNGKVTVNGIHGAAVTNAFGTFFAGNGTNTGFSDVAGSLMPGDTNVVGTLTLASATLEPGADMFFDLGPTTTVGGTANDLLQVNGDLTVNANNITINPQGLLTLGSPYRIINYTGTLIWNGDLTVSSPNGYVFTVDTNTLGQIKLTASGGPPVWNGGSVTSSTWTDAANWNGVAIQPNTALYFDGVTRLNNTNDTAAGTSYDIVFSSGAGAFTLNGNPITLMSSIGNNSASTETVNVGLSFGASATLNGASGPLIIGGGVTNTANLSTLTLAGSGTVSNLFASADPNSMTNILSVVSNATWTLVDNPASVPITMPVQLDVNAGTFTYGSAGSAPVLTSTAAGANSRIGISAGVPATFNMVNGTLTISARLNTGAGANTIAAINQTGGTLNLRSLLQVSDSSPTAATTVNVTGGTLNVADAGGGLNNFFLASRGTGVVTIATSGTINCAVLDLSRNAAGNTLGSVGVVNLDSGGTLTATRIGTATSSSQAGGTPTATFNFNGGTLIARASSATFIQGNASAPAIPITSIVKSGGAIIDTTNFNISILEPLIHDASLGVTPDGGLVKKGTGTLTLPTTSTYTGSTIVSNGTLALNGVLTASAVTVATNGTLTGSGILGSSLNVDQGGTVAPGPSIALLTVTNNAILSGTTLLEVTRNTSTNDVLKTITGNITYGGVLRVTNIGGTLMGGDTFRLFNSGGGSYLGSFTSQQLPGLAVGLSWNTTQLAVNGTIFVTGTAVPPVISQVTESNNVAVFSGTGGVPDGRYIVVSSTNVLVPLASWTRLQTNSFDGSGAFTFTSNIATSGPNRFFRLLLLP